MSPVLTFICAGAGLMALLAAIGLLLGPSEPRGPHRRVEGSAHASRRGTRVRRLAARRARSLSAVQSAHLRDLSTASDEADRSA